MERVERGHGEILTLARPALFPWERETASFAPSPGR